MQDLLVPWVILKLGDITNITTKTIEGLFSADLAYLQDFYNRINETGKINDSPSETNQNDFAPKSVTMGGV